MLLKCTLEAPGDSPQTWVLIPHIEDPEDVLGSCLVSAGEVNQWMEKSVPFLCHSTLPHRFIKLPNFEIREPKVMGRIRVWVVMPIPD